MAAAEVSVNTGAVLAAYYKALLTQPGQVGIAVFYEGNVHSMGEGTKKNRDRFVAFPDLDAAIAFITPDVLNEASYMELLEEPWFDDDTNQVILKLDNERVGRIKIVYEFFGVAKADSERINEGLKPLNDLDDAQRQVAYMARAGSMRDYRKPVPKMSAAGAAGFRGMLKRLGEPASPVSQSSYSPAPPLPPTSPVIPAVPLPENALVPGVLPLPQVSDYENEVELPVLPTGALPSAAPFVPLPDA